MYIVKDFFVDEELLVYFQAAFKKIDLVLLQEAISEKKKVIHKGRTPTSILNININKQALRQVGYPTTDRQRTERWTPIEAYATNQKETPLPMPADFYQNERNKIKIHKEKETFGLLAGGAPLLRRAQPPEYDDYNENFTTDCELDKLPNHFLNEESVLATVPRKDNCVKSLGKLMKEQTCQNSNSTKQSKNLLHHSDLHSGERSSSALIQSALLFLQNNGYDFQSRQFPTSSDTLNQSATDGAETTTKNRTIN